MGKIAFVFSGQGDQYPGMGKDLYDRYEAARAVFQRCEAIRPGTLRQCFEGTAEELKETVNTQPCMFAMELAAAAVLEGRGLVPDAAAGFSLGEVAAAAFAGLVDLETGFRLVCKRGEWMQAAAEQVDSAMMAVVKLPPETVRAVCDRHPGVYPVNFNCPGQITVSGLAAEMAGFAAEIKAAGGRALPLRVKGAFHSPYMAEAAAAFGRELAQTAFQTPRIPLYSNVTAAPYEGDPAQLLARQIESPVLWEQLVRNLIASGVDTFVELGPGGTLTNLIKKTDPAVTAWTVTEYCKEAAEC